MNGTRSRCVPALVAAALGLLAACVTEGPPHKPSSPDPELWDELFGENEEQAPAPSAETQEPEAIGPPSPAEILARIPQRPGERVLMRSDGRISKFFAVRAGRGTQLRALAVKYCELPEAAVELVDKADIELYRDPRAVYGTPNWNPSNIDISDWLVVTGNEEEIGRVERFLNQFYASVPQIEIEARIAEVTTDNVKDLGAVTDIFSAVRTKIVEDVDPATAGTQDPPPNFHSLVSQIHSNFPNTPTVSPSDFVLRAILGKTEVKSVLKLLVTQRNVDIVSSPRIAVRNGGRAEIVNGDEIPYVNVSSFTPSQSTFSGSVQYKQTGVKLYIIPYLTGTDTISLNVEAEVSFPSGFTEITGVSIPIIATRNAKTDVHIREGSTFVIGGLISSNDAEFVKKVPFLGDIPLLGLLFRSTFKQKIYTEVLFFITPRVIHREELGGELIVP